MKKILCLALMAVSFSGLANANNGVYTSLKAGVSETKYKNSSDHLSFSGNSDITFNNSNQTKSTYPTISVAAGYDFSTISPINARAELEYTYKDGTTFSPDIDSITTSGGTYTYPSKSLFEQELTTHALMLNGYYDFKNQSKFTPYVSAGIGSTHVKNKLYATPKMSDNHFTWSTGIGVNYAVSQNVGLDLSYRYVDAGKFNFDSTVNDERLITKFKLMSNEYLLGIRYNF